MHKAKRHKAKTRLSGEWVRSSQLGCNICSMSLQSCELSLARKNLLVTCNASLPSESVLQVLATLPLLVVVIPEHSKSRGVSLVDRTAVIDVGMSPAVKQRAEGGTFQR